MVKIKQLDSIFVDWEKYTKPYLYENGWLYYELNYFDQQSKELKTAKLWVDKILCVF